MFYTITSWNHAAAALKLNWTDTEIRGIARGENLLVGAGCNRQGQFFGIWLTNRPIYFFAFSFHLVRVHSLEASELTGALFQVWNRGPFRKSRCWTRKVSTHRLSEMKTVLWLFPHRLFHQYDRSLGKIKQKSMKLELRRPGLQPSLRSFVRSTRNFGKVEEVLFCEDGKKRAESF